MRILIIDDGNINVKKVQDKYPNSEIVRLMKFKRNENHKNTILFRYSGFDSLINIRNIIKKEKFDKAIIPFKKDSDYFYKLLSEKFYFFLPLCGINNFDIYDEGIIKTVRPRCLFNIIKFSLLFVIAPIISLLYIPLFLIKEFLPNFLSRNGKFEEFTGFSYFGPGGHLFFLTKAKMSEKFGIFGIDHQEYMGTPVSLHRSPLEILLFRVFGHKRLILVSWSLIILSLVILTRILNNNYLLLLIPILLLSNYSIKSIMIGHTEFLGWGFFLLSIIAYALNHKVIAAIFFSLIVLSHINIALIAMVSILLIELYFLYDGLSFINSIQNLFLFGLIAVALTSFFIYPFMISINKLSRNKILNKETAWNATWSHWSLVQLATYSLFVLSAFILVGFDKLHLILLIPLIALIINTKIKWLFSQYTIELAMLFTGSIFLFFYPNIISILLFVYCIYTSPIILTTNFKNINLFRYKLIPLNFIKIKKSTLKLLSAVPLNSRVAIEDYPRNSKESRPLFNVLLSYIKINSKIELLNGFSPEFVEENIYFRLTKYINAASSKKKLNSILKRTGSQYLLAYTPDFIRKLKEYGYKEIGKIDYEDYQKISIPDSIILFKSNFKCNIIEPKVKYIIRPNNIELIDPQKNVYYFIKYNYYPGWRAYQNGRIKIKDMKPGMLIKSMSQDKILLRYKYSHFLNS